MKVMAMSLLHLHLQEAQDPRAGEGPPDVMFQQPAPRGRALIPNMTTLDHQHQWAPKHQGQGYPNHQHQGALKAPNHQHQGTPKAPNHQHQAKNQAVM